MCALKNEQNKRWILVLATEQEGSVSLAVIESTVELAEGEAAELLDSHAGDVAYVFLTEIKAEDLVSDVEAMFRPGGQSIMDKHKESIERIIYAQRFSFFSGPKAEA